MEAAGRPHFGALLRQFRLDAGLTQQELAERAKLSVEAISTLERGVRTRPYRDTVALLARALELTSERETLLENAVGSAHPSRQRDRSEALPASLLRIVRPDTATPKHNLPQQLTSFVGRQHEVREIAALLQERRLVTVVGAGGVGKTRVAVRIGNDVLDGNPDGVWLVDLAALEDPTFVPSAVLNALQLPSTAGSAIDAVVAYLKTRRLLLILDNCEHVIARAGDVASSILQSCPDVRILSTSRQALEIQGEHVYRLPSLTVPLASCRSAEDILTYGAVALFVDRTLAGDAGCALSDDDAPDVAEICRRLDGIPLAIEMAAARVKVLSPRQIAEHLDQRFRLLTGGETRALPRHRTMTALIDWSYDLLTPREQGFFESLSVFAGACTLEAAAAVCGNQGEDDIEALDCVTSLVTKSLLVAELVGSQQRYRLLESTRHYARDKLVARGEHEQVARRHALFYVDLAEELERAWHTMPEREWFPHVQVELENWRAVFEWAITGESDVLVGQRLAAARKVVSRSFPWAEGRRWVRAAINLVDERTAPDLLARLAHAEADGLRPFGEHKALLAAAQRALVRYRELGDQLGITQAQLMACGALVNLGQFAEAQPLLQETLEAARSLGDRRLTASVLREIGDARSAAGDFAGARAYYKEALGLANIIGAEFFAASLAISLSKNESDAGDVETALALKVDLLSSLRARNSALFMPFIATTLCNLATDFVALSRFEEARSYANEALELAHSLRLVGLVAFALLHLVSVSLMTASVEGRSGKHAGAARLCGFAERRRIMSGRAEEYGTEYDRSLAQLRDAIGSDELERLMADGATMSEDEAIEQAHALE